MGLDIHWYKNLTAVGKVLEEDDPNYPDDGIFLFKNEYFSNQFENLVERQMYEAESSGSFRAGSYSGYNDWRNTLAKIAGYEKVEVSGLIKNVFRYDHGAFNATDGPFHELINFSDCEGTIGPLTSKKLASDFEKFINEAAKEDDYFFKLYKEWKNAFEMASQNGAVCFH